MVLAVFKLEKMLVIFSTAGFWTVVKCCDWRAAKPKTEATRSFRGHKSRKGVEINVLTVLLFRLKELQHGLWGQIATVSDQGSAMSQLLSPSINKESKTLKMLVPLFGPQFVSSEDPRKVMIYSRQIFCEHDKVDGLPQQC